MIRYPEDYQRWLLLMGLYETRYIIFSGEKVVFDADEVDDFFTIRMEAREYSRVLFFYK